MTIPPAATGGPGALIARVRGVLRGDDMEGTLARGALWAFGINVAGTIAAFGVQLVLARSLGEAHYGIYIYTLGWLNVVLLVAKLDWDHVSLRYLSAYSALHDWSLLRGFLRRSDVIVGATAGGAALLAAAAVWLFRSRLPPSLVAAYWASCALLPVTAFLQVKSTSLQGLRRVVASQAPQGVLRPVLFALGLVVLAFGIGTQLTAALAIVINLAATAVVLVVAGWLLHRAVPAPARHAPPAYATREWLGVSGGMLAISAAQLVLSQNFDIVVVGSLLGTTQAGYYGAATQLAMLCHFGVNAILFMTTPLISELFAAGDRGALQRLITFTSRLNVAVSLPVALALLLGGRLVLRWYGPSFVAGYPVLVVLLGSQLAGTALGSLAGFLMSMTGHQNRAAVIIGLSAVLYLALTFVFTLAFGAVGTAFATLIALLTRGIVLDRDIRKRLGIEVLPITL